MFRKVECSQALVVTDKKGNVLKCLSTEKKEQRYFIPFFRRHAYPNLTPFSVSFTNGIMPSDNPFKANLASEKIPAKNANLIISFRATIGISKQEGIVERAAEHLLNKRIQEILEIGKKTIIEQLREITANFTIERIDNNRTDYLNAVCESLDSGLKKYGLRLINLNIADIDDDAGIIEAKSRAEAVKIMEEAKRKVAERKATEQVITPSE